MMIVMQGFWPGMPQVGQGRPGVPQGVQSGDVIWMAPYCAQWFVAMGKSPARYLYYKDVNRPAL